MLPNRPAYFGGRAKPPARYNPARPGGHGHNVTPVTPAVSQDQSILGLVNMILEAQQKPIRMAEEARQKRYGVLNQQMANSTAGVVAAFQQAGSTGANAYNEAIQQTDALGRQAASYFQGENPNADTQATLKAIGAPVAQQQAVGAQNQALFNGGPNYVLGAQIPGASLAAQKAAQVGFLQGLPAVAASQGAAGQVAFRQQDEQAHQAYLTDIEKVLSQTPQLVQGYQAQAASQAEAARKNEIAAAAALQNARYLAAQLGLKGKALDLAVTKEQHAYEVASRNAQTAADRADTYATGTTNTDLNQQERNRIAAENAETARQRAAAAAAAGKIRTGKQRQSFFNTQRSKVFTLARTYANQGGGAAPTKPTHSGVPDPDAGGGSKLPKIGRLKARTKLQRQYGPPLRAQGFKQATINKMINNALDNAYGARPRNPKPNRPGTN